MRSPASSPSASSRARASAAANWPAAISTAASSERAFAAHRPRGSASRAAEAARGRRRACPRAAGPRPERPRGMPSSRRRSSARRPGPRAPCPHRRSGPPAWPRRSPPAAAGVAGSTARWRRAWPRPRARRTRRRRPTEGQRGSGTASISRKRRVSRRCPPWANSTRPPIASARRGPVSWTPGQGRSFSMTVVLGGRERSLPCRPRARGSSRPRAAEVSWRLDVTLLDVRADVLLEPDHGQTCTPSLAKTRIPGARQAGMRGGDPSAGVVGRGNAGGTCASGRPSGISSESRPTTVPNLFRKGDWEGWGGSPDQASRRGPAVRGPDSRPMGRPCSPCSSCSSCSARRMRPGFLRSIGRRRPDRGGRVI